jgi:uncharacterized protein
MSTTECPICRKPVRIPPDDEPLGTYPFCSERCKLVDLGRWLDGRYQIPVAEKDEDPVGRGPSTSDNGDDGEG